MFTWKRKTKTHLKSFNIHILTCMNTIHQESSTHLYSLGWCSRLPVFSRRVRMQCRIAQSNSPCLCVYMRKRERGREREREWAVSTLTDRTAQLHLLKPPPLSLSTSAMAKTQNKAKLQQKKKTCGDQLCVLGFSFQLQVNKGISENKASLTVDKECNTLCWQC